MKHVYSGENDSTFDNRLWNDYPLAKSPGNPDILYLDHFHGERKARPLSAHDHWEFIGVLDGCGELESESVYELRPNCIILVPPGVMHRENAAGRMEILWLGFNIDFRPDFPRDKPLTIQSEQVMEELLALWRFSMVHYEQTGLELEGRLLTVLGGFWREFKAGKGDGISRIHAAVRYLQDNYSTAINMTELAHENGLSESHFYREFKRLIGQTPVNYLIGLRLGRAAVYLRETSLPIAEIAELCGFNDPYYFCRVFVRRHGVSPSRFRKTATR